MDTAAISRVEKSLQEKPTGSSETGLTGAFLIVTTVNDAKLPSNLPRWAERRLATYLSTQVYNMLYQGITCCKSK
jgi:hypothetical protein